MLSKNSALVVLGLLALVPACSSDATAPNGGAGAGGTPTANAGAGGSQVTAGSGMGGSPAGSGGSIAGTAGSGGGGSGGASAGAGGPGAGGTSSGGTSSGGSAGAAGASGGAAPCTTSGSELCEDFESGSLDARWTQSKSNNSSIKVEGGTVHSGKYAVHLAFTAGQQSNVTIAESATFANTGAPNKFYARMWVYFGPEIPKAATGDFHTGFLVGGGKNDKGDVIAGMGMIGSDQQWLGYSIFFGTPKYEFGPWSNPRIKAKEWQCIELFEDGTDANTEKRQVWLNDVEMKELASDSAKAGGTANPNHHPPKFDKVIFGLLEYHPIPTLSDMWLDDLRVSAQKIGCK